MTTARTDIIGIYPKFFFSVKKSARYEVRVLANFISRDLRSTTGENLKTIRDSSCLDPLVTSFDKMKNAIDSKEKVDVQPKDQWRICYLWNLSGKLQEAKHMALVDEQKELQTLIDSLVI